MEQTRDLVAPTDAGEPPVANRRRVRRHRRRLVLGCVAAEDQSPTLAATELADRDPALERLLPTAHRGDDEVAAEFRRLTEHGLRERKAANLTVGDRRAARTEGDQLELTRRRPQAVVVALTDVRLVLGERLGLRTDEDADGARRLVADPRPGRPGWSTPLVVLRLPHLAAGVADHRAAGSRTLPLSPC